MHTQSTSGALLPSPQKSRPLTVLHPGRETAETSSSKAREEAASDRDDRSTNDARPCWNSTPHDQLTVVHRLVRRDDGAGRCLFTVGHCPVPSATQNISRRLSKVALTPPPGNSSPLSPCTNPQME